MDITLEINGRNFSRRLSTYNVEKEPFLHGGVKTTMDGTEHFAGMRDRTIIRFSLLPTTDQDAALDFAELSKSAISVTFTDPYYDTDRPSVLFRCSSNLSLAYGLRSANGNRYYKGAEIEMRAIHVD